jgi:Ricin-type beta-trefoil lectin domain-like
MNKPPTTASTFITALILSAGMLYHTNAAFVIDSLSGDITSNEINNFISTVAGMNPPANNWGNEMATHGTEVQGMRRMYEATRNVTILNHYIRFSDSSLSKRNDKPGGEGRVMWQGTVAPVWPNLAPTDPYPGYAGCESGMVAGNIACCAMLILENKAIWNTPVPDGNPYGYGVTYKDRAVRYLSEVDYVCNNYITTWFINSTTNRVRKPSDSRWSSNAGGQSCTAWNRQWMFIMPYLYSARCHDILGDNPSYLSKYKDIVNQFATWFAAAYPSGGGVYYTSGGRNVAKWYYEVPTDQHIENIGHAQHDVFGLFESYQSRYTGITSAQVKIYADTTQYIINKGATNSWAGNVDGTGSSTYLKTDFIWLAQWNRALYQMIAQSNISANQLNNAEGCKNVAYILYMKRWLYTHTFGGNYRLVARHSGLGVNVSGASTSDGAAVIQWPYAGGSNEKWQLVDLGGGYYWFKAVHSGKAAVIQGASTANGALAIQWSFTSGNSGNDEWRLDYLANGYYRFINRHSGKVLEVPGGSTASGTQLGQWSWASVNHQQFQIISVP